MISTETILPLIILVPLGNSRYRATLDGETLVQSTAQPIVQACRVLFDRGLRGKARVLYSSSARWASTIEDIAAAAGVPPERLEPAIEARETIEHEEIA